MKIRNMQEKEEKGWLMEGVVFGVILFFFNLILQILSDEFEWKNLPVMLILTLLGGLMYGFFKRIFKNKKNTD